jgi:hypothetical protein
VSIPPVEKRKFQFDKKQQNVFEGDQLLDRLDRCPSSFSQQ